MAPRFTDSLKELAKYLGCYKSKDQKELFTELNYLSPDNDTLSESEKTNFSGYSHFSVRTHL